MKQKEPGSCGIQYTWRARPPWFMPQHFVSVDPVRAMNKYARWLYSVCVHLCVAIEACKLICLPAKYRLRARVTLTAYALSSYSAVPDYWECKHRENPYRLQHSIFQLDVAATETHKCELRVILPAGRPFVMVVVPMGAARSPSSTGSSGRSCWSPPAVRWAPP